MASIRCKRCRAYIYVQGTGPARDARCYECGLIQPVQADIALRGRYAPTLQPGVRRSFAGYRSFSRWVFVPWLAAGVFLVAGWWPMLAGGVAYGAGATPGERDSTYIAEGVWLALLLALVIIAGLHAGQKNNDAPGQSG